MKYDTYVVLTHEHRDKRLFPNVETHRRDDVPDWRSLLIGRIPLGVWLVEGATKTSARDFLLAHLAGHAPSGVTRLYRKPSSGSPGEIRVPINEGASP